MSKKRDKKRARRQMSQEAIEWYRKLEIQSHPIQPSPERAAEIKRAVEAVMKEDGII